MYPTLRRQRTGFTLVELMVVILLMLILVGMAALVIPSINKNQQATMGATQLQQWFEAAKQRAARDRAPRGVRLLPGSLANVPYPQANPYPANLPAVYFVTDLVNLVQQDDYYLGQTVDAKTGGIIFSRATLTNNKAGTQGIVTFDMFEPMTGAASAVALPRNLTANHPVGQYTLFPVQGVAQGTAEGAPAGTVGDHIVFDGGGTVYKIQTVTGKTTLQTTLPFPTTLVNYQTTNYKIMRQPRPDGDEPLQMPQNIVIDCYLPNQAGYLPQIATPGLDIMFAPDGRVIGPLSAFERLIFWVRDLTATALNEGDPTLVVIYTQTGLIAAQPVDLSNYNSVTGTNTTPYTFTTTGVRSAE